MPEHADRIDALASLIEEFNLSEASLSVDGFTISFKKSAPRWAEPEPPAHDETHDHESTPHVTQPAAEVQQGTVVTSPMNGIFYDAPSPSSPPFVKEGDEVSAGQVIGLIEAMKVFNEVPCPYSGTVLKLVAEPGAVVQPGDVLMYVGQ